MFQVNHHFLQAMLMARFDLNFDAFFPQQL